MSWETSNRREGLPANWDKLRLEQLERDDFRCVMRLPSGARCPNDAVEVDHYGKPWEHDKLRSLCHRHHAKRTAVQAKEARDARRPPDLRRPPEKLPPFRA